MVIDCEYCGTGVALGTDGWRGIQKHTMLPLNFADRDKATAKVHDLMDSGFLHRHVHEDSTLEEMSLTMVPYWIVQVSARTSIAATDMAVEAGQVASTAALLLILGGAMGGRRRFYFRLPSFSLGLTSGSMGQGGLGPTGSIPKGSGMGFRMFPAQHGTPIKTYEMDENYEFPVVALKALSEYQPKAYQFKLSDRMLFDSSKITKSVKILNGDIGEEAAKYQAKTLVDQLQSEKAHAKYHLIQQLQTELDVAEAELLHAPIWFIRYDHKGKKRVLVLDGNSGDVINSIGL